MVNNQHGKNPIKKGGFFTAHKTLEMLKIKVNFPRITS